MTGAAVDGVRQLLDRARDRARTVWWGTFLVVFGLSALWSLALPLAAVPDEPFHITHAAAVWHGGLTAPDIEPGDAGFPSAMAPYARHLDLVEVPAWVAEALSQPDCFAFHPSHPADCARPPSDDTTLTTSVDTFGRYPPTYYLLVGWPTLVVSGDVGWHVVRLVSAAICAALVASAAASIVQLQGRPRFAAIGLGLAMTPMALFLFAGVTSSGFEVAAALVTWTSWLALLHGTAPPSMRLLTRTAVASAAVIGARPSGFVYLVVIVAVVAVVALTLERVRELASSRAVQVAAASLAVLGVAALGWYLVRKPSLGLLGFPAEGGTSLADTISRSWSLLGDRTEQLVGNLGWLDTPLPGWMYTMWLGLVAIVTLSALALGHWRQRLGLLAALGAVIVVPIALETQVVDTVGFIWQGRYTLPLAVGVPLFACWIIGDRLRDRPRAVAVAAVVIACTVSVLQLLAHARGLDRYVHGLPADLFSYLDATAWRPTLGRRGQLGAAILLVIAWAAWLSWLVAGSRAGEPTETTSGPDQPEAQIRPATVEEG